jgi:transglutaminase-like putative cysteine protease
MASAPGGGIRVQRTLTLLVFGLHLVGLVTILLSGELPTLAWGVALPLVLLAAALPRLLVKRATRVVATVFVFALFASLLASALTGGEWLLNAVYFVMAMAALKLFQRETDWDHYQVVALSFLQLLGGAILNPSIMFGVSFIAYVVLLAWTLMFLHFHRFDPSRERLERGVLPARFFVVISALAVVLFLSSLTLFFLFPRLGFGFFLAQVRRPQKVAGFTDQVELGGFGTIQDNQTVVARVRVEPRLPPDAHLRLRGISFATYDGRAWKKGSPRRREIVPEWSGAFKLHRFLDSDKCPEYRFTIYLEPLDTTEARVIFGLPWMTEVRSPRSMLDYLRRAGVKLYQDHDGDVFYETRDNVGMQYEETSSDCGEALVDDQGAPRWVRELYTQVPEGLDPRVRELSERLTGGQPDDLAKARAVLEHLQRKYHYSLNERHSGADPVADFLFDNPYGHCEYFATAMALLLRAADVPARVANGFYGGRWNPLGGYFQIRQGDAHSWVEVWLGRRGWVTFDPTPATERFAGGRSSVLARLDEWMDYLRYRWYQWVVEYNLEKQMEVFKKVSSAFDIEPNIKGLRKLKGLARNALLGLLGLGLSLFLLRRLLRWWRLRARGKAGSPAARRRTLKVYSAWVKLLTRKGLEVHPSDTPLMLARKAARRFPGAEAEIRSFTQALNQSLYAATPPSPAYLGQLWGTVQRSSRSWPRT